MVGKRPLLAAPFAAAARAASALAASAAALAASASARAKRPLVPPAVCWWRTRCLPDAGGAPACAARSACCAAWLAASMACAASMDAGGPAGAGAGAGAGGDAPCVDGAGAGPSPGGAVTPSGWGCFSVGGIGRLPRSLGRGRFGRTGTGRRWAPPPAARSSSSESTVLPMRSVLKTRVVRPMSTTSPSARRRGLSTRTPFTFVPLLLCWSWTTKPPSRARSMSAWAREQSASSRVRSQSSSRPMRTSPCEKTCRPMGKPSRLTTSWNRHRRDGLSTGASWSVGSSHSSRSPSSVQVSSPPTPPPGLGGSSRCASSESRSGLSGPRPDASPSRELTPSRGSRSVRGDWLLWWGRWDMGPVVTPSPAGRRRAGSEPGRRPAPAGRRPRARRGSPRACRCATPTRGSR